MLILSMGISRVLCEVIKSERFEIKSIEYIKVKRKVRDRKVK